MDDAPPLVPGDWAATVAEPGGGDSKKRPDFEQRLGRGFLGQRPSGCGGREPGRRMSLRTLYLCDTKMGPIFWKSKWAQKWGFIRDFFCLLSVEVTDPALGWVPGAVASTTGLPAAPGQ